MSMNRERMKQRVAAAFQAKLEQALAYVDEQFDNDVPENAVHNINLMLEELNDVH
jgi:hypothetical protein